MESCLDNRGTSSARCAGYFSNLPGWASYYCLWKNQLRPRCPVVVKPKPGQRGLLDLEAAWTIVEHRALGALGNLPGVCWVNYAARLRITASPSAKTAMQTMKSAVMITTKVCKVARYDNTVPNPPGVRTSRRSTTAFDQSLTSLHHFHYSFTLFPLRGFFRIFVESRCWRLGRLTILRASISTEAKQVTALDFYEIHRPRFSFLFPLYQTPFLSPANNAPYVPLTQSQLPHTPHPPSNSHTQPKRIKPPTHPITLPGFRNLPHSHPFLPTPSPSNPEVCQV